MSAPIGTSSDSPRVIAYRRVSTREQSESGAGMDAQRRAIAAEAERRRWTDVEWVADDGFSAKDLRRPGITRALDRLAAAEADILVVAKLDRLSRSLLDFARLMTTAQRQGWALVALDLGVDTTTPAGKLMANVMMSFAEYERELIGVRTADALAARKAAGVRLGRPVKLPQEVRVRVHSMRSRGMTLRAIADALTDEGVPTAQGGLRWHASTVRGVLASYDMDQDHTVGQPQ